LLKLNGLDSIHECDSAATSSEEIGNDIYPPMKRVLFNHGIPFERHYAKKMTAKDYESFDLILCMDEENMWGLKRIVEDKENKIFILPNYVGLDYEIEDPWYTGRYELVFNQIYNCLERLIEILRRQK
jgi:protein-tyrosine phosphatase